MELHLWWLKQWKKNFKIFTWIAIRTNQLRNINALYSFSMLNRCVWGCRYFSFQILMKKASLYRITCRVRFIQAASVPNNHFNVYKEQINTTSLICLLTLSILKSTPVFFVFNQLNITYKAFQWKTINCIW